MNQIEKELETFFSKSVSHKLKADDDFFELGLVDSLFALQLVAFVEEKFDIKVEGDDLDLDNFCTMNALSSFVERKLSVVAK